MNTQKPWFSAKNSLYCIRIWNHTQKYYDLKSRQALPDGVFGHFNARKSYPLYPALKSTAWNPLQNPLKRAEILSKTELKINSKNAKEKPLFFQFQAFRLFVISSYSGGILYLMNCVDITLLCVFKKSLSNIYTKPNYLQQAEITITTNQILRCNIKLRTLLNKTKSRLISEVSNILKCFNNIK